MTSPGLLFQTLESSSRATKDTIQLFSQAEYSAPRDELACKIGAVLL